MFPRSLPTPSNRLDAKPESNPLKKAFGSKISSNGYYLSEINTSEIDWGEEPDDLSEDGEDQEHQSCYETDSEISYARHHEEVGDEPESLEKIFSRSISRWNEEDTPIKYSWSRPSSPWTDYGGEKEDELYEDYNLTKRAEKAVGYGRAPYSVSAQPKPTSTKRAQQTPTGQKKGVSKDSAYTSNTLVFSGSSKNPEVYLSWEINREKWLRSNNIPKEKKLSQAVQAFTGNAYKWWLKESSPSIYNQPVVDWRDLKVRMYKEFAEKYQDKVDATSKFHCQATRRKVMSTPKPLTVPKPKKAHDHEPKAISSSVLTHQAGFKRSAQLNKVQPQPITTPLPELQKLQEMCQRLKETLEPKEENTSNQGKSSDLMKPKNQAIKATAFWKHSLLV
ncbi:hypothetical protein YC2023_098552 [Brassica napus]